MSISIPSFVNEKFVDKNGYLTPTWASIIQQLLTQLQSNFKNEGFFIPTQSASNLTVLANANSSNSLIIDSDNQLLKVNLNGTYQTVQTV